MRRLVLLLLVLCSTAPTADAAPVTLAEVPSSVPVGALQGWVAWSVPVAGGWTLSVLHDGAPVALAVPPRAKPFDLDLGTDAAGRVVATFSRCRKAAAPPEDYYGDEHVGCRVRVLDLASGAERAGGVPRPAGSSDTMPSMWQGRIAFARTAPKADVDQVLLWDPARGHTRRLKHGALPTECADFEDPPCKRPPRNIGQVSALDLGARLAAFRWNVNGESVTGHAASELRASTLDGRRSTLLAGGYVYEACDESDSVTTVALGPPTVDGTAVSFTTDAQRCDDSRFVLRRVETTTGRRSAARLHGLKRIVLDGARLVGLERSAGSDADCPCTLEAREVPRLR